MHDRDFERVGDFLITYDLPTEAEMADDGGCAAFLADTVRRERRDGPGRKKPRERVGQGAPGCPDVVS